LIILLGYIEENKKNGFFGETPCSIVYFKFQLYIVRLLKAIVYRIIFVYRYHIQCLRSDWLQY